MAVENGYEPKILGFLCNWCSYQGADLAGTSRMTYPPNLRIVRVMCSGRVDPLLVVSAFKNGVDGVLIAGCHPGDCHYTEGNLHAARRFSLLQPLLDLVGVEPERVRLEWVSAAEARRFVEVVSDFTKTLKALGPRKQEVRT